MKLHYATKKLERVMTDNRLLKKYYSNDYVRIRNRLSELLVADSLEEIPVVPPPRRHKLSGDMADCWGIDYSKNDRIVIQPMGEYDINSLDTIKEVKILRLEDYH